MLYGKEINIIFATSVYAINNKLVLGYKGDMPWRGNIPSDMERFKALTKNCAVIMGRKTWDSLPKRPLSERQNIILSKNPDIVFSSSDITIDDMISSKIAMTDSFDRAISKSCSEKVWVMGGSEIFRLALPFADFIYQTMIYEKFEGDVFFPKEYRPDEWRRIENRFYKAGENSAKNDKFNTIYSVYRRKAA